MDSDSKKQQLLELLDDLIEKCHRCEDEISGSPDASVSHFRKNITTTVEEFRDRISKDPSSVKGGYGYGFTRAMSEHNAPQNLYEAAQAVQDFLIHEWD